MAENEDTCLNVLVGGEPLPVYKSNGCHFVECKLNSAHTYTETTTETVADNQEETQVNTQENILYAVHLNKTTDC